MYWDHVLHAERVRDRLAALTAARRISFAGACVTHVLQHFLDNPGLASLEHVAMVNSAMLAFWKSFPPDQQLAERQVLLLEPSIPDDDAHEPDSLLPGRYDLVMAAIFAHECAASRGVKPAVDAAAHAYQAIFDLALRPSEVARAEPELDAAEQQSDLCRGEVAFQIEYLRSLEVLPSTVHPVFEVVRRAGSGTGHPVVPRI